MCIQYLFLFLSVCNSSAWTANESCSCQSCLVTTAVSMVTVPSDIKNCWKIMGIFITGSADNDDGCGDQEVLWWAEVETTNYKTWYMVTFITTEGTAISCFPWTPKMFCHILYQKLIWKCHVGITVSTIDGWGNMQIKALHSVTCITDISRAIMTNMIDAHLGSSDISRCKFAWTLFTQENRCAVSCQYCQWPITPYVNIFLCFWEFSLTQTSRVQRSGPLTTLDGSLTIHIKCILCYCLNMFLMFLKEVLKMQ